MRNRNKKPWFVKELYDQRRIMKNRERVWLKYKDAAQWKAYTREKNISNTVLKLKKSHSLHTLILENKHDTKKLYQTHQQYDQWKTQNPMPPNKTDEELADKFANHFLDNIEKIRSKVTTTRPYTPKAYNTPAVHRFITLTADQLYKVIMDMPTKSCELDIISTKLLKQVLHSCIPDIMKIINLSLDKGDFSSQWKTAVVHSLIKSLSNGTNINNYRPVSNLPFISKVAEKCNLQQLSDHCYTYDLLPEYQSAYRKNFSCETCLLKLTNDILWGMENKKITAVIILDLLAAFNTVDHDLLLEILDKKVWNQGHSSMLV